MSCAHDGYHGIRTSYDRSQGVLVYFWVCEGCGEPLQEATREVYRPAYVPYRPLEEAAPAEIADHRH